MAEIRSKALHSMQYLKGPGFADFLVVLMAVLAGGAFWSESIHWAFALILGTPLVFGTLPKLRLIAEMNRRMADRRKHQPNRESNLSAASKRIRDAGSGALRRMQGLGLAPLQMPKFPKLTRTKSPRSSLVPAAKSTCSVSEPNSPRSTAENEPRSPILSPEAISRRLNERLHFNGDKNEFFSRSKFAGCLRQDECHELFKLFEWVHLEQGELLFEEERRMLQGDSSESGLYMLVEGKLGVYLRDDAKDGKEFLSYHMLPGDSIGDTHVLAREDTARLCTLRASQASVVMQLTRQRFRSFCELHPDGLLLFLRLVLGRLHRVSFFVLAEFLSLPHLRDALPDCLRLPANADLPALFEGSLAGCVQEVKEDTELYAAHPKHIFVLLSGALRITAGDSVCTEERGACVVGARALWTALDPKEKVVAVAGSRVGMVDMERMLEVAGESPQDAVQLMLTTSDVLLPVIHSFISLGLSRHWVSAGEPLFEEGDEADGLYLLITGRVRLGEAAGKVTTEVGRGDMVGEEAFLEEGATGAVRRRLTATALRDCELVKLSPRNLELICRTHPQVALKLVQSIARRQLAGQGGRTGAEREERAAGHSKTANLAVMAMLPLNGESEGDAKRFTRRLARSLGKFGSVLVLDEARIGEILGGETVAELDKYFYRNRVSSWIVQQEEDYRFILLLGDRRGSAWSQVCVSQADAVLLLALHESLPAVLPAEQATVWEACAAGRLNARTELVLLHTESKASGEAKGAPPQPRLTRLWMEQRPVTLHHHVRVGFPQDLERMARHLAGRSIGLVLGGGGARGLAHLGVLRAMEELQIPVDFIGGTSQGAYMAALYAQKLQTAHMGEGVTSLSEGIGSLMGLMRDFTLPVLSMFSGKSFSHTIRQSLGPLDIRDTWINFFCVSCSVSGASQSDIVRVHRAGTLWKYVRASMTVVGYLPPVWDDGDLLVDGGYVNNLPSDEMVKMGVHTIIGVDVEDKEDVFKQMMPLDDHVSGWSVLWFQLLEMLGLSGGFKVPKHRDITTALCYITHYQQFPRAQAMLDLKLSPPCVDIALLDYHKRDDIVQRGYDHAMEQLQPWLAKRDVGELGTEGRAPQSESMPMMGGRRDGSVTWDQVVQHATQSFVLGPR